MVSGTGRRLAGKCGADGLVGVGDVPCEAEGGQHFGPGRAALLAAQLPATDAEAAARRAADAAKVRAVIKKLDAQQNAQITALEDIPGDPGDPGDPAVAALRARIRDWFAELHNKRHAAETLLAALTTTADPAAADPAILDEIPYAGDILPELPPQLKARLLAAFDITILWNKPGKQATVTAVITDNTLQACPVFSTQTKTATTTPHQTPPIAA